jgi:hypothetical protein
MGLSDIAKAPVSHGVEPHDLETGLSLRFRLQPSEAPAGPRRGYRASGFVLGRNPALPKSVREWQESDTDVADRGLGRLNRGKRLFLRGCAKSIVRAVLA